MPFLEGPFAFTGKLDMLSAYRMRGVDKIVVRRKGGPSAEKVKKSPRFENTRRTMSEFGGCSRHGSYVRMAMRQLRRLSDYNFGSDINSIMRQVQLRDGTSEWGRRSITLSEHTRLLEGFSTMYKAPSFDSIVRTPVYYTMDRANRSARIEIPELMRDINYFPQNNHAMFRLTATLGIVPDVTFDVAEKEYLPPTWYDPSCYSIDISTGWNPSLEGMESTVLELAMDVLPPDNRWTLMLSIGIEYGAFREGGKIDEVKRFGAAKILALRGKEGASGGGVGDNGMEDKKMRVVDEAGTRDLPMAEVEKASGEYREPEVRYVYTMKETNAKEPALKIYTYSTYAPTHVAIGTGVSPGNGGPYATAEPSAISGLTQRHKVPLQPMSKIFIRYPAVYPPSTNSECLVINQELKVSVAAYNIVVVTDTACFVTYRSTDVDHEAVTDHCVLRLSPRDLHNRPDAPK